MPEVSVVPPEVVTTPKDRPASIGFILRKMVWTVALGLMGLLGLNSFASFYIQTGAPQQGAAAAWGCFQMITIYVVARALDELTRGKHGV